MSFVLSLLAACSGGAEPGVTPAAEPAAEPAKPAAGAEGPSTGAALNPGLTAGPITLAGTTGPIVVTPVYHGTVRIEAMGKVIWIDPWSKANLAGPPADIVFITDIHPDHLDEPALAQVVKPDTVLVAPKSVADALTTRKVDHVLANGESLDLAGITVRAVPMYNNVRGPEEGKLFHDKGRGDGYLLGIDGKTVYIAGDTECTDEMKALTWVDLALVPMNLPYTMTPEEAAECVRAFKPAKVTPYHYAGSDLAVFSGALAGVDGVEVVLRDAYPGGLPW